MSDADNLKKFFHNQSRKALEKNRALLKLAIWLFVSYLVLELVGHTTLMIFQQQFATNQTGYFSSFASMALLLQIILSVADLIMLGVTFLATFLFLSCAVAEVLPEEIRAAYPPEVLIKAQWQHLTALWRIAFFPVLLVPAIIYIGIQLIDRATSPTVQPGDLAIIAGTFGATQLGVAFVALALVLICGSLNSPLHRNGWTYLVVLLHWYLSSRIPGWIFGGLGGYSLASWQGYGISLLVLAIGIVATIFVAGFGSPLLRSRYAKA